MRIVHALYDTRAAAARAVRALERHGIGSASISMISGDFPKPAAEGAELGAGLGAIAGGAGGLLAGLGMVAIPGIGPVLAVGWLVPAALGFVAGAAAGLALGGVAGALVEAGIPAAQAQAYEAALARGGTLVTALVREEDVLVAEHALEEATRAAGMARRPGRKRAPAPEGGPSTA